MLLWSRPNVTVSLLSPHVTAPLPQSLKMKTFCRRPPPRPPRSPTHTMAAWRPSRPPFLKNKTSATKTPAYHPQHTDQGLQSPLPTASLPTPRGANQAPGQRSEEDKVGCSGRQEVWCSPQAGSEGMSPHLPAAPQAPPVWAVRGLLAPPTARMPNARPVQPPRPTNSSESHRPKRSMSPRRVIL